MIRPRHPQCPVCTYDLDGFQIADTCPECGWQIEFLRPAVRGRSIAQTGALLSMLGVICDVFACGFAPLVLAGIVASGAGLGLGWCAKRAHAQGRRDGEVIEAYRIALICGVAGLVPALLLALVLAIL